MGQDRITEITIEGLRSIARLSLPLQGLTVLIGENGSGKSSIVEACEILRRAAASNFLGDLGGIHGGLFNVLRHGASELRLTVRVEGSGGEPPLRYQLTIAHLGMEGHPQIKEENLDLCSDPTAPVRLLRRSPEGAWHGDQQLPMAWNQTVLFGVGLTSHPAISRVRTALENIEVHVPFEMLPAWAAAAHSRRSMMRATMTLEPAERLARFGSNLANAYHTLRAEFGEEHWQTTMDYVRLGLGDQVDSVNTRVDPGGGAIGLWMKLRGRDRQLPASALSDGTLAYLAFVALYRLRAPRSLLVFDEPDLHLNPALLNRVLGFFEAMAEDYPVLLTTHSDRLLDSLADPASAVRVCELSDIDTGTQVRSLDREALAAWLEEYRGVGELRSAGFLSSVMKSEDPA